MRPPHSSIPPPPPPPSSARCAPAPAGHSTLEVPRRSERRQSPHRGPNPGPAGPAASGGSERVGVRFGDIRRETQDPKPASAPLGCLPGWGRAPHTEGLRPLPCGYGDGTLKLEGSGNPGIQPLIFLEEVTCSGSPSSG
ncbi:iroquois-class homeodomain protein IRX-3 [Bubalus bubalis]|uniref:iroquois-class homeodomain protein IRX-3 n=1 Tax=Bubalus bubalis TaxID=89462 RepID=UPI001E1B792D|nr:iroquois-class homeodomain protein IRX-3 [Bubalus bubalis]